MLLCEYEHEVDSNGYIRIRRMIASFENSLLSLQVPMLFRD